MVCHDHNRREERTDSYLKTMTSYQRRKKRSRGWRGPRPPGYRRRLRTRPVWSWLPGWLLAERASSSVKVHNTYSLQHQHLSRLSHSARWQVTIRTIYIIFRQRHLHEPRSKNSYCHFLSQDYIYFSLLYNISSFRLWHRYLRNT